MRSKINYSQSWEDPAVLREALRVDSADTVLSVTSGGDNTLALLLDDPKRIVSVDSNPAQTELLRLKIAAIRSYSYGELLTFLGYRSASVDARARLSEKLVQRLPRGDLLEPVPDGVVHSGKFDRFLLFFSSRVLPLIHSQSEAVALCDSRSLADQMEFFQKRWNTWRWRLAFRFMAGEAMLRSFARQRGMFSHVRARGVAETYRLRFEQNLMTVPVRDNHFVRYSLLGRECGTTPDCFREESVPVIRERSGRVEPVTADILVHLRSVAPETYSGYNLSDVFEALAEDRRDMLWSEIARTAMSGARVAFWENLAPVSVPPSLQRSIIEDEVLGATLRAKDRAPFYGAFRVFTINP